MGEKEKSTIISTIISSIVCIVLVNYLDSGKEDSTTIRKLENKITALEQRQVSPSEFRELQTQCATGISSVLDIKNAVFKMLELDRSRDKDIQSNETTLEAHEKRLDKIERKLP